MNRFTRNLGSIDLEVPGFAQDVHVLTGRQFWVEATVA